jgi:hypothetical protein
MSYKNAIKERHDLSNANANGGNRENQNRIMNASQSQSIDETRAVLGLAGANFVPTATTNGVAVVGNVVQRPTMPDNFTIKLRNDGDGDAMFPLFDVSELCAKTFTGKLFTCNTSETTATQMHRYNTVQKELGIGNGVQLTMLQISAETENDTASQKLALAKFLDQELQIIRIDPSGEKRDSRLDMSDFKSFVTTTNPNVRFIEWTNPADATFFENDGLFFVVPAGIRVSIKATIQNELCR